MDKEVVNVEKDIKQMSGKMDTTSMGRMSRVEELQGSIDNTKENMDQVTQGAQAAGQPITH